MKKHLKDLIDRIEVYAEQVGTTYGKDGKNVLINPPSKRPFFTVDGVTVVAHLPQDDLAANLLTQAARYTVANAGDGTTGTILLISALLRQTWDDSTQVDRYLEAILPWLENRAQKVETLNDLINVASIAAHDSFYGEEIAKLVWELGAEGVIKSELGESFSTRIDPGYKTGTGALLPFFIDDTKNQRWLNVIKRDNTVLLNEPLILLIEEKIANLEALVPVHDAYAKLCGTYDAQSQTMSYSRPLVMIVGDVEDRALQFVRANFIRKGVPWYLVKSPEVGNRRYEMLQDIQKLTDTPNLYSKYDSITLKKFAGGFGSADMIELTKSECSIIVKGADLESRKEEIRKSEDAEDFKNERISRLSAGVGVITLPAASDGERFNLQAILDDTIHAAQGALTHGMQKGGRTLYLDLGEKFPFLKPTFEKLGIRLPIPEGDVYDSAKATHYMFTSAFRMASQIINTSEILEV